jgi:signal transduction histidine kinase
VVAFVLAAVLPLAVGAWLASRRLEDAADRLRRERAAGIGAALARERRRIEQDLVDRVRWAGEDLGGDTAALVALVQGRASEATAALEARRLRFRFDVLVALDATGEVAAGTRGHRPGLPPEPWRAAVPERAIWLPPSASASLRLISAHDLPALPRSGRRFRLVGVYRPGSEFLASLGESVGATLSLEPAGAGANTGEDPVGRGAGIVEVLDGPRGTPVGRLVATLDLASVDTLRRDLRRWTLGTGLFAVVLAGLVGAWLAGWVARPVDRLARAMEGVATGEWDLSLSARSPRLGRLSGAFSRMIDALAASRKTAVEAERRAAWREAARRVAHEVKNPLSPIRAAVENLRRAREHDATVFDEAFAVETATVLEEVERLRRLVDEFSRFARLPHPEKRPTDLAGLVREIARRQVAGHGDVHLELNLDETLPEVACDPDQVAGVVANLVANAVQALGEKGGRVEVSLASVTEGSQAQAEVLVSDDGPGIPAEDRERVFEPYWTTRERGGGTGLGLAIALRVAREHGGTLELLEREGPGAAFRLRLPMSR